MLKNIDPLLHADLLHVLRAMGHGDELAIVDRNFPAQSTAQRLVRLDGVGIVEAARAILSVYPIDTFIDPPVFRMEVVGDPQTVPNVQRAFQQVLNEAEGRDVAIGGLERFAFYERTRDAYAVVATSEDRGYGCFLLSKGVVPGPE